MDTIYDLVEFAKNTSYQDLPSYAVEGAKMLLADALAVSAAGSTADGVAEASGLIFRWGGTPESSSLVFGRKLPAYHAAYLNSLLAHARDYDDFHPGAVVHAGITVIPTVLAMAEAVGGISGPQALTAIAVATDVLIRMGFAITVSGTESGWIYSALLGHFSSALAAGLLLGLDDEQLVNALGIVYSQAGGNQQAARDTSLTKRMQPAFAARSGVFSAYLAQAGITGSRNLIDGTYNFYHLYLNDRCDRTALTRDLGKKFWINTLAFKPYPVCGQCMSPASTVDKIMKEHGLTAADIIGIDVGVNRHGYRSCVEPEEVKFDPQRVVDGQFSIPFATATMAVKRHLTLGDLTETGIQDSQVHEMIARIHPYVDEDVEARYSRGVARAKVTIRTAKGDFTDSVYQKGHPDNPFDREDMASKFDDAMNFARFPVQEGAPQQVLDQIWNAEKLDDFSSLVAAYNNAFLR